MIGTTISHYSVVSKLGEGGMGEVYRARDTKLERDVAIKVLPQDLSHDPERLARFQREAKTLAALTQANISAIYGIEEKEGNQYLILELVEGQDLSELLKGGPLPVEEVARLTHQLADALTYAHSKGIVHRDLKPGNIRIQQPENQVKVLDFGLARAFEGNPDSGLPLEDSETMDSPITQGHVIMGTPQYMSPEQATGSPHIDHRSDIYSMGCVVYEMLTGKTPYNAPDVVSLLAAHATSRIPNPKATRGDLPAALQKIFNRALAKIPEDRYQSAADFATDIQTALVGKPGSVKKSRVLMGGLATVLVIGSLAGALWFNNKSAQHKAWVHETAIPGIEEALENRDTEAAWNLYQEIQVRDPGNEQVAKMADSFSKEIPIVTEPEGVTVYRRFLDSDPDAWTLVGTTPMNARLPSGFQRFRFEKQGYATAELANHWYYMKDQTTRLAKAGEFPEDMVYIPGGEVKLNIPGLDHLGNVDMGNYLIAKDEVTNAQYAEFVRAGGYEKPEYWKEPFLQNGDTLSFSEAMALFKDRTEQPGPASWKVGDYPDGQGNYPVTGISWYEAAAYCNFAGRELPTLYHWNRAAETRISQIVVPESNFADQGPSEVGEYPGLTAFGVRDMAGNAREWCSNMTDSGHRVVLGGGWNDQPYMFNDFFAQDPWDRSETNGLRTVKFLDDHIADTKIVIKSPRRDFMAEEPVSDEVFDVLLNLYSYDKEPLESEVLQTDNDHKDYKAEKVEFNAAYGGERMQAYVYTPKQGEGPFPTVVYFPGSNAIHGSSSDHLMRARWDWFMKQGYAFIYPIYKSTYERGDELDSDYPDESQFYQDHVIMWGKDMSRAIDYLESRPEFDTDRLAYFGASWGGGMGPIMLAIEPRFKAGVLLVAGFLIQKAKPAADPINFVTRVKIPVLMLNGKYDHFFPVESTQIPLYKLLGTPPEHKKHFLYEDGHRVPNDDLIRETLAWLEKYVGKS
ncbi:MAG: protein kinase [Candidatus Eisenbacteria bacterium]|uniref:non-specific serine/threonine protein kinase n=1 Tax=Eiseniibacteriota bacterium TaxID=2212470 RepID=A0A7Y2EAW5_UNCEI|nr:protein kinase [Candidatus Eisenbacteria bacterium]